MCRNCGPNRTLFRQFSAIEDYEGWMIGKIRFCSDGKKGKAGKPNEGRQRVSEGACVTKHKRNYAVIEAFSEGCLATMFIIKPDKQRGGDVSEKRDMSRKDTTSTAADISPKNATSTGNVSVKTDISAEGNRIASHIFSASEIIRFVEEVQDMNTIHRMPHPIVPGLQMVEWFWSALETDGWKNCEFVFRASAYADQELWICRRSDGYDCVLAGTEDVLWQARILTEHK